MSKERFVLMHKNTPVMDCIFDDSYLVSIGHIYSEFDLPVMGMLVTGKPTISEFADWWEQRAIPKHRFNLKEIMQSVPQAYQGRNELVSVNLGLSLSDQYWVRPQACDVTWEQVNFLQNDFGHDLSDTLLDGKQSYDVICINPSSGVGGNLPKAWKIFNGDRYLVKASSKPYKQEAINEVIGSQICDLLSIPHIQYQCVESNEMRYSLCKCNINQDEDIVSAHNVLESMHCKNGQELSVFKQFLATNDIEDYTDAMIAVDYLLQNEDRHLSNLCVVRDVNTGKFTRMFPLFDFGNSLGFQDERMQSYSVVNKLTGHMYDDDLRKLKYHIRNDKLLQIPDIVNGVLNQYNVQSDRCEDIVSSVKQRIDVLLRYFSMGDLYGKDNEYGFE